LPRPALRQDDRMRVVVSVKRNKRDTLMPRGHWFCASSNFTRKSAAIFSAA
jgi:hypothetical protein